MKFLNSTIEDFDEILRLYDLAIEFQKTVFDKTWLPFDRKMLETEITEKRHWKILLDDQIACIFSIAFSDPLIWKEKNDAPAIYIHRIVTNPDFRGHKFVPKIVDWAHEYTRSIGKKYIRMDTWGDNQKLIDYYINCGFEFLGVVTPTRTAELPKHYEGITLSLFEINIEKNL
jgi:RimJ/RimL family protein N-acetyltransferase